MINRTGMRDRDYHAGVAYSYAPQKGLVAYYDAFSNWRSRLAGVTLEDARLLAEKVWGGEFIFKVISMMGRTLVERRRHEFTPNIAGVLGVQAESLTAFIDFVDGLDTPHLTHPFIREVFPFMRSLPDVLPDATVFLRGD